MLTENHTIALRVLERKIIIKSFDQCMLPMIHNYVKVLQISSSYAELLVCLLREDALWNFSVLIRIFRMKYLCECFSLGNKCI